MVGVQYVVMKAKERDSVTDKGLYPDGERHVAVRAKSVYGGTKWTSGLATGETGKHDEHFEVRTESPIVEPEKRMYHKEDIKHVGEVFDV